jgi:hypothetical protein
MRPRFVLNHDYEWQEISSLPQVSWDMSRSGEIYSTTQFSRTKWSHPLIGRPPPIALSLVLKTETPMCGLKNPARLVQLSTSGSRHWLSWKLIVLPRRYAGALWRTSLLSQVTPDAFVCAHLMRKWTGWPPSKSKGLSGVRSSLLIGTLIMPCSPLGVQIWRSECSRPI